MRNTPMTPSSIAVLLAAAALGTGTAGLVACGDDEQATTTVTEQATSNTSPTDLDHLDHRPTSTTTGETTTVDDDHRRDDHRIRGRLGQLRRGRARRRPRVLRRRRGGRGQLGLGFVRSGSLGLGRQRAGLSRNRAPPGHRRPVRRGALSSRADDRPRGRPAPARRLAARGGLRDQPARGRSRQPPSRRSGRWQPPARGAPRRRANTRSWSSPCARATCLHYAVGRVIDGADADLALLAGDYLYALGLGRLAALGDLEAVRELSDLISLAAQVHDGSRPGEDAEREASALLARLRDGDRGRLLDRARRGQGAAARGVGGRRCGALGRRPARRPPQRASATS